MPAERGPSGTGHDTACECDAPRCERDGCQDKPTPTDPPVAVPGPASARCSVCHLLGGDHAVWCSVSPGPASVSPAEPRTYAIKVYLEATPDEFDALHDKVLDAVTDALGCDDSEHECPHFRLATAGPRRYEGRRFWALRCGLRGLWEAVRYGEV